MGNTQQHDTHRLTPEGVAARVKPQAIGAYALGIDNGWAFTVLYVGRSDQDLASSLHEHAARGRYRHFEAHYRTSPQEAFEQECVLFHQFDPPDNRAHPCRPQESDWRCPHCAELG